MSADIKSISITDFIYELPEDKIAKYPLVQRDQSKLLQYQNGKISETVFSHLPELLPEKSLLVFNDTRVIHARLLFQKETGAHIEVFCLEPLHSDYASAFSSRSEVVWKCMVGNAKRWKGEILKKEILLQGKTVYLFAEKQSQQNDTFFVRLCWNDSDFSFAEIIEAAGVLPIPPYLNREANKADEATYQTVYARYDGSVAAPTAGLHFTDNIFEVLKQKQVNRAFVTLHVGAGTFKPVKSNTLGEHEMHEETIFIPMSEIEKIHRQLIHEKKIVAVGTTSTRTLESIYWHGVKVLKGFSDSIMSINQWDAYEINATNISAEQAIGAVIENLKQNKIDALQGYTRIIIAPGYQFKIVDILITNFHQPENTLILLIAAFVGQDWRKIYDYALHHNFRFLSYGDSSILYRD